MNRLIMDYLLDVVENFRFEGTGWRILILLLAGSKTAKELAIRLKLSTCTIYRWLDFMIDLDLIKKIDIGERACIYDVV